MLRGIETTDLIDSYNHEHTNRRLHVKRRLEALRRMSESHRGA
jgi:hypothetical protein